MQLTSATAQFRPAREPFQPYPTSSTPASTTPPASPVVLGGSGFATPVVSGVIALMLSKRPGMSHDELRAALDQATQGGAVPLTIEAALAAIDS